MRMSRTVLASTLLVGASALVLAGCSSDGNGSNPSSSPATGTPIEVAAIASQTFFPEAPQAAQAVFDDYNASGGFDGHPIKYTVYDDKNDPSASASAAQSIVSSDAVAVVGSSSLIDCIDNHGTWEQNGILAIQGTGVDPYCFTTPNISPTNTGPYFDTFASLTMGSEQLGFENICAVIVPDAAAAKSAYEQAIDAWSKATGKQLAYLDTSLVRGQQSYAANISALKSKNCDAIFDNDVADGDLGVIAEAANQGLSTPFLLLTSAFSDQFMQSVSYGGDIYLPAEFAPYYDSSVDGVADWQSVMAAHNVTQTSFAQGGYLAAKDFIAILETIKGDVTRESFTAAAEAMTTAIPSPMAQSDWTFGKADFHASNATAYPVVLKAGSAQWESLGPLFDGEKSGWVPTVLDE